MKIMSMMKVKCIKDVVMDDGSIDFTAGKEYDAVIYGKDSTEPGKIVAYDDQGDEHTICGGHFSPKSWFDEHFTVAGSLSQEDLNDAYDRAMGIL